MSLAPTAPRRTVTALLLLTAASGCARPLPGATLAPLSMADAAADAVVERGTVEGPLSFERALALAVERDPELASLRAGIEGAGAWPPAAPLALGLGADSDGRPEGSLTFDLLSVLGQGPRRAERVLAHLRRDEAGRALHARVRETARDIAAAYAREAVLAAPPPAPPLLDPEAFVKAGLAPPAAQAAAEAARRSLAADEASRAAEREANRVRLAVHFGRRGPGALQLLAPEPAWPPVPEPDAAALLANHPEVVRRLAAYEVSRGELLRAQSLRDPGLELSPSLALDPTHFFGAVTLRLPLGAEGEIRAAFSRMEAARLAVRAAVLAALAEASAERLLWRAAEEQAAAAEARLHADLELAGAERARVEAQGEGFGEAVLAANSVVGALREVREARLEAARLRVSAAWAAGWPAPATAPPTAAPCAAQGPR